ncbi:zinc finger protein 675-like [Maniola hyperantus]|uniref:zinc finger protein 675-like n=1 Tax=Aphantopus hyperantus TaxID=2795564 RepID=UPI003747D3E4
MTSTAVNSSSEIKTCSLKDDGALGVKKETEVIVKQEIVECLVCLGRSGNYSELNATATAGGTLLSDFLNKFTHAGLNKAPNGSKYVCKTCLNLVNILEQAELEYYKAREEFHAVISKNPLFEPSVTSTNERVTLEVVKNEDLDVYVNNDCDDDSEDEPLALTKKKRHRKVDKRKKKPPVENKRKLRSKDSADSAWECGECAESGKCGGEAALTAHMLVAHLNMQKVKKEESPDRSQSPNMNCLEEMLKLEVDTFDDDDDDSSIYTPEPISNGKQRARPLGRPKKKTFKSIPGKKKKKDPKVMHQCDQCNARYTSIVRLEQHKSKHDDSKPPYICEVCGAHYKHKRACDIHVALHKGISDWKCEECNKLFPSKGALQRHNNIHTGKLNYQCDLCGKSFIHTSSFKMHKLSHSGVKPHSCDVCGLALMTRSHLKRHKRVHSGEKRHECAVCGKRFSERYNLVAHARAHQGAPEAAHAALPRRRLFRCAFCPERFERRYMLERHAGAAHGRALERPPPTPRNTMSKLLKAQAQRRDHEPAADGDSKLNRSPESRGAAGAVSAITWAGAYAAEFGLRPDYSH